MAIREATPAIQPRTDGENPIPERRPRRDPRDQVPELGFRQYWYPALPSSQLKSKPKRVQMLGWPVGLFRDGDKVFALHDVCPHRGVPLTFGRLHYPGTVSCVYHGWTFRMSDGQCVAALTDGPQSPIPRMTCVKSYPAQERAGMIWVFMGDGPPPALEDDVPEEILRPDARLHLVPQVWACNWRPTMDNAIDSAHAMYLHRVSVWLLFSKLPAWVRVKLAPKGNWMGLVMESAFMQADYPGLGRYPRTNWWRKTSTPTKTFIRLPGVFKVEYAWWTHIRWAVPIDANTTQNFNWAIKEGSWLTRLLFSFNFLTWLKWTHYENFSGQDKWICEAIDYGASEKLCRTDVPVIEWRKLAQRARQHDPAGTANGAAQSGDVKQWSAVSGPTA